MLQQLLEVPTAVADWALSHITATLLLVAVVSIAASALQSWMIPPPKPFEYQPEQVGDITAVTLRKYDGRDPYLPLYFAVKGEVFDVSKGRDFYGPGAGYAMFAGRECSRALALMSLDPEDCCAELADLTPRQLDTLQEWLDKFRQKYHSVGRVVPEQRLSLQQLAGHNGSDPDKAILLAVRGTVFDVTKGREFYGPEGVYPFAGRECARALAKMSTDTADCSDDLQGLDPLEISQLRDWEGRFFAKYNVVGTVADKSGMAPVSAPADKGN